MGDKYMKEFLLPDNGDWVLVASAVRSVGIQFQKQGTAHVHIGDAEPDDGDAKLLIASAMVGQPSTISFGQLPDDAQVWLRSVGNISTEVTVLAY